MSYRDRLPQMSGDLFVTDGGLETTLVFLHGIDLPDFAAFPLLATQDGRRTLADYYASYLAIAAADEVGIVLETPTWRANADWGARLGCSAADLASMNRDAVDFVTESRAGARHAAPVVVSGQIGPRGDGYRPGSKMTVDEARAYHSAQIAAFAASTADMVCVLTMNYSDEAAGVAWAAADHGMPAAISFTVETDGRLPSGEWLGEAVDRVDETTQGAAAYFMINCAHPTHFASSIDGSAPWAARIRGIRANASTMSHAELDNATELDDGDPEELGRQLAAIRATHPHVNVLGGCCGTDDRHIAAISRSCR